MFIKQRNIMIEIIYMTTYLKQNSSKPSIFQRNMSVKARFHSMKNFFNHKKQTRQQSHKSSEKSVVHGKINQYAMQFLPLVQSDGFGCMTLGSLDTLFSQILIVM